MITLRSERRGDCLEPTSARLIADPLTFLAEDHLRQRQICALLTSIAMDPHPEFRAMGLSLAFLRHELLLHNADERTGLFPMMLKRCQPEDEIHLILNHLQNDHDRAQEQAHTVCAIMEAAMETHKALSDEQRATLKAFATLCQRYLILENAITLRIARVRLRDDDLEELSQQMLLRRGLIEPNRRTEMEANRD